MARAWCSGPSATEEACPLSGRFNSNFGLRLSADGSLVGFRDWDGQRWTTYAAHADGSAREAVCDDCALTQFAPERRTVYLRLKGTLVRRAIDSRRDTALLDIPSGRLSEAAVSADGKWIAVLLENADRTAEIGISSLQRLPVREADLAIVAHDARHLASPRWSVDGSVLYYLSQRDGFICIWGQRLDARTRQAAGEAFAVLHQHQARLGRFGPKTMFSFETAAQRLLFNLTEARANLWTATMAEGPEQR